MSMTKPERREKLKAIIQELSDEEQLLLNAFMKVEKEKLHMEKPRNIQDDLWKALTETIR